MISLSDLRLAMGALSAQRFHFLVVHLLGIQTDGGGNARDLTPGEAVRICLADRLALHGIDNDTQYAVLKAWDEKLDDVGTHWAEALMDDAAYIKAFFAVSDCRFSSMPYSQDSRFYDAQDGKWIDVLPRHAEVIIHLDLTEMMLRILSRINERRGKHGQEPIDLRPASEVSSS